MMSLSSLRTAGWILALAEPSVEEVLAYLDRFCSAVLLHETVEALLSERRPDGRSLYDAVEFPEGSPERPAG